MSTSFQTTRSLSPASLLMLVLHYVVSYRPKRMAPFVLRHGQHCKNRRGPAKSATFFNGVRLSIRLRRRSGKDLCKRRLYKAGDQGHWTCIYTTPSPGIQDGGVRRAPTRAAENPNQARSPRPASPISVEDFKAFDLKTLNISWRNSGLKASSQGNSLPR